MSTGRKLVQLLILLCNLVQMVQNYSAQIHERQGERENARPTESRTRDFRTFFSQTFGEGAASNRFAYAR